MSTAKINLAAAALVGALAVAGVFFQPANAGPWADLYEAPEVRAVQTRAVSAGRSCKLDVKFRAKAGTAARQEGAAHVRWTETVKVSCDDLLALLATGKSKNDCARPGAFPQVLADANVKASCDE